MSKLPIEQYLKEAFKRNKSNQTHKDVHARAVELIRRCWAEDVFIIFTDGLRTNIDQAVLYGKGRKNYYYNGKNYSNPSAKVVTKAKPGTSMHNFGLALDFVTCDGFGKNIDWVVGKDWKRAAAIAKELGFSWGGDWKSFYDAPHIEYSRGYAASQIAAGKWPVLKSFKPIKLTDTEPIKKEEVDKLDFTSETTKSAVRDELQQAVDKKIIDGSWLDKFDEGTMTNGDYAGLKLIIAHRSVAKLK